MDVAPYLLQIFNQSPDAQLLVTGDGNVLAVNTAFTQLSGYPLSQLLQQPVVTIFPDVNKPWQDILSGVGESEVVLSLLHSSGKMVPVQMQFREMASENETDRIWSLSLNKKATSNIVASTEHGSESRYLENVLQSITDGFLVINKNGDVLFCNQTAAQIMRIQSVDDLLGKNIWEQVPALNILKQYPGYDSVIQHNQPVRFKEYFPGYNFWVEISVYPSEHSIVVYFKDVNDTVRNKKIQSLERDVLAMNANPYKSLQALLDFYIHAIEQIFPGLSMILWKVENELLIQWSIGGVPEQLVNSHPTIAIADSRFLASNAIAAKKPLVIKSFIDSEEKDLRAAEMHAAGFASLTATPLLQSNGELLGVLEVLYTSDQRTLVEEPGSIERMVNLLHVILENKLAQEHIRLSNQRYDLITKATNDIIWEWDMEKGLLVKANSGFSDFFGTEPGKIIVHFHTWKKLLHPDDFYRVIKKRNDVLRNPENLYWEDEFRMVDVSGKYNYFYHKAFIVRDEKGKANRLFGATQNITRRKEDEALLIDLNNKLKQRADELAASNVELERFAYVASHDMQEPLRMITSFLQLFRKKYQDQIDETAEQYLHFVMDGADRMKRLITDLLEYSRIGSNKGVFEPIDTAQVMKELEEVFVNRIAECNATIVCKNLPVVKGNKTQLFQLFQNLVGNALKYVGKENPLVVVQGEEEEHQFLFSVSDNGIGIKPMYFEKIFVLFQRLHHKHEYSGTGIGLSVCKKIVEKHGGKIWVTSEPDKGSTFYFTIKKEIPELSSSVSVDVVQ